MVDLSPLGPIAIVPAPRRISTVGQSTLAGAPAVACGPFADEPERKPVIGPSPPDEAAVSGVEAAGALNWLPLEHPPSEKTSKSAAAAPPRPSPAICRQIPVIPRRYIYPKSPMPLLYQGKSGHPKAVRRR